MQSWAFWGRLVVLVVLVPTMFCQNGARLVLGLVLSKRFVVQALPSQIPMTFSTSGGKMPWQFSHPISLEYEVM
jgi:hypothetical protein